MIHHCLGCKNPVSCDVPALYEPAFYTIRMQGDINPDQVFRQLNDRVCKKTPVYENTIYTWFYFCHEYVHFLQDLRCAYSKRRALSKLKCSIGLSESDYNESDPNIEQCKERLTVKACTIEGEITLVHLWNHEPELFTEVALFEVIAIILEDKLWHGYHKPRNVDNLPYDLPYRVAEFLLGENIIPSDDLKPIVVDVCEAALMTVSPVTAFMRYFKAVGTTGSAKDICYEDAMTWFHNNQIELCEESDSTVFNNHLYSCFKDTSLQGFAEWISPKIVTLANRSSGMRIGLFRAIYEERLFKGCNYADQFALLFREVAYPLIRNDSGMFCSQSDKGFDFTILLGLMTAYDVSHCGDKKIACAVLPYCKSAGDLGAQDINRRAVPKVSEACQSNPINVNHGEQYSCPFQRVWTMRMRNAVAGR